MQEPTEKLPLWIAAVVKEGGK